MSPIYFIVLLITIVMFIVTIVLVGITVTILSSAPWVPTANVVSRAMCKMAGIKKGDRVIDLGCGDASILIVAAREYGAISYGVELNPVVAMMARARIRLAGVQDKVTIVRGNMYKVDLPDADIAMMYMLPKATLKIEGILRDRYDHLKVVSHGFELKGKTLEKVKVGGAVLRRYEW